MAYQSVYQWCTVLYFQIFIIGCLAVRHDDITDIGVLNVGQELEKEILSLERGQRIYQLHGLKASSWYEVKISYSASIPASFSIQLKWDVSKLWFHNNRKLLNTEKLVFEANTNDLEAGHNEMHIVVTVEAAGIVAKPHIQERKQILFNIVCDELSYGIPKKAWWVGMVAALCLILALSIPHNLPSYFLLVKNQSSESSNKFAVVKAS